MPATEKLHFSRFFCMVCLTTITSIVPVFGDKTIAEEPSKPTSPRAMFRVLGIEDSIFEHFADGSVMNDPERENTLRILYRLRLFPAVDLQRWAQPQDQLAEALRDPASCRGSIFRLRGQVVRVEPQTPSDEDQERFELKRYFHCKLKLDGTAEPADIYTEQVPKAWQAGGEPNAPGGVFGVFLKSEGKSIIFAATRLAWYPDTPLGRLGMDVGLLDLVENQKPITAQDREAFYQMLAAAGRAKADQLLEEAEAALPSLPADWRWTDRQDRTQYSVTPLFNEAATQRGRLVELLGAARRVERIELDPVQDADIMARFGFDHYFQVSLFTEDSQGNPLTFCVLDLPDGMPYGNIPRYGETVRIAGFFFKTWSYAVPRMADPSLTAGDPKSHHQLSPLLIGRSLTWYPAQKPADNTFSNALVGGLFVAVMVMIWLAAWFNRRREHRWIDRMESPEGPSSGQGLDQLGATLPEKPDFSRLAEMDHGTPPADDDNNDMRK